MAFDLECDILIVGAGPAGLSCSIALAQQAARLKQDLKIYVLEKSPTIGAHLISGAILNPTPLKILFPNLALDKILNWQPVTHDKFCYLTERHSIPLPVPKFLQNNGNYLVSLCQLGKFLGQEAEKLGVQIFTGFAGDELILDPTETRVIGIKTTDQGLTRDRQPKPNYQPGVKIGAKYTLLAEGCRGSLTKQATQIFNLDQDIKKPTYGLGIKEIWQLPPDQPNPYYIPGQVFHSIGWPLDHQTHGGSFVYHYPNHQVAIGFIVALDYRNPTLSPFEELQRFKHHPAIKLLLAPPNQPVAKRISYGARALNEGGYPAIPKLIFPGGALLGCSARLLNPAQLKGIHNAIYSGIFAAQAISNTLNTQTPLSGDLTQYEQFIQQSDLWQSLYQTRNIRPSFQFGRLPGLMLSALETYITHGKLPWTISTHADHDTLKPIQNTKPIQYPKPDNLISFDRLSSLLLADLHYTENQPCHLKLKNPDLAISVNYKKFGSPEQFYCPAQVYEIIQSDPHHPYLQINAQNCIHCKACDIKDPTQNINWTPPENGDGPAYRDL